MSYNIVYIIITILEIFKKNNNIKLGKIKY